MELRTEEQVAELVEAGANCWRPFSAGRPEQEYVGAESWKSL